MSTLIEIYKGYKKTVKGTNTIRVPNHKRLDYVVDDIMELLGTNNS